MVELVFISYENGCIIAELFKHRSNVLAPVDGRDPVGIFAVKIIVFVKCSNDIVPCGIPHLSHIDNTVPCRIADDNRCMTVRARFCFPSVT